MELVYMDDKKEPYTTSAIIAECAGVKHHAIQEHIRKQIGRLEQFGKVSFKMRPYKVDNRQRLYFERATGYFADYILEEYGASGQLQNQSCQSLL